MKRRLCEPCEAVTNANPCKECGAVTTKLARPVNSIEDLIEDPRELNADDGRQYLDPRDAREDRR